MFEGQQEISLDEKGRLAVPARFRRVLQEMCGGQLTFTLHHAEPCLMLYARPLWEDTKSKLMSLPSFDAAAQRVRWIMVGHAEAADMDKQGRVLVPSQLRERASLQGKAVLTGQGNYFEIWERERYQQKFDALMAAAMDAAAPSVALNNLTL